MARKPKVSILIALYNQEVLVKRAMESIPERDDIEVVIIDDKSTDNSYQVALDYAKDRKNWIVLQNEVNMGADFTYNRGLDTLTGEYFLQLDSDDCLVPENISKVIDLADQDLVWFDMDVNNGDVWSPNTMKEICDHGCLYRMSLVGKIRHPRRFHDGGWFFHRDVISQPHTERFTCLLAYHYNFPRRGSLMDLHNRGLDK